MRKEDIQKVQFASIDDQRIALGISKRRHSYPLSTTLSFWWKYFVGLFTCPIFKSCATCASIYHFQLMPINFNERGYIIPPDKVELSLEEFWQYFVDNFPDSSTRKRLYAGYVKYTKDFRREITSDIIQWIGGSFTTTKLNPRDMDIVTIIPHQVFEAKNDLIEQKFRWGAKTSYGVDAYIVAAYAEEHKKFPLYQGNLVYWDNQFSKTRKNRAGKQFKRGYVQVIHQKIEL